MNPTTSSVYDNPALGQARSGYETAANSAVNAQATQASLPDMLKDALTKKFSMNNPQVANRESLATNYLNTTTQAPLDYTARSAGGNSDVIYNPLQQANLINTRRNTALSPLLSANYLLDLSSGGIQNVIDSTSRAHQGLVSQLEGQANIKRNSYQDLLSELQGRAQETQAQVEAEENRRRYDQEFALKKSKGTNTTNSVTNYYEDNVSTEGSDSDWEVIPQFDNILDYNKWRTAQGGL